MDDSGAIRAYSSRAEKERDGIQGRMTDFEAGGQSRLESVPVVILEVHNASFLVSCRSVGDAIDEGVGYLLEPGCRS